MLAEDGVYFFLSLFNDAFSSEYIALTGWMSVNNKFRMGMEAVHVLPQQLPGETKDNDETRQP